MKYVFAGLLLNLLLMGGCCRTEKLGTVDFTPGELSANPYHGAEVLRFNSDSGETMVFKGEGRESDRRHMKEHPGPESCSDWFDVEYWNHQEFNTQDQKTFISLSITSNFDARTRLRRSADLSLSYNIMPPKGSSRGSSIRVPIDSMEINGRDSGIFFDSMTIGNTLYFKVFKFPMMEDYQANIPVNSMYYSVEKGILGFTFKTGKKWHLLQ